MDIASPCCLQPQITGHRAPEVCPTKPLRCLSQAGYGKEKRANRYLKSRLKDLRIRHKEFSELLNQEGIEWDMRFNAVYGNEKLLKEEYKLLVQISTVHQISLQLYLQISSAVLVCSVVPAVGYVYAPADRSHLLQLTAHICFQLIAHICLSLRQLYVTAFLIRTLLFMRLLVRLHY
ncbi:hypothetical protein F511_41396 [Dorcoceras hygrometricum]|uniref:Myb/SANT-like domain-containing protein n=1 Tax=Dorcoceras hygrometricum TaxID=472368 RepID=A0A2Z7C2C3_9LAMI|nr:hypothetical protein F511_41396 [Dorcoceras hygrometricum]